jgi:hypothetical protein
LVGRTVAPGVGRLYSGDKGKFAFTLESALFCGLRGLARSV